MAGPYYSMMADVRGKLCVVVGGGAVAERKIGSLLEAEARVSVISPSGTPQLEMWAAEGRIEFIREPYAAQHRRLVEQAMLVLAATDQAAVNRRVAEDAVSLGRWVNVADQPEKSSFIVPSSLRRGKLTIAVSTSGASPGVSARIRQRLEQEYGEEYAAYIDLLEELRELVQDKLADTKTRQKLSRAMLDWELLPVIRAGKLEEIRGRLVELVGEQPDLDRFEYIAQWLKEVSACANS
ncbi:precorrin-2 dehydrogenase/sirohydrochlorin ferrochelatase family protein [Paenibacillus hamazuiensis]|uniref:precorrin-2 dehydrogenase/sirohydrochlorin ferrochelatase family protein n=1 Tax=Paenibacillus hamazuiensis TaxID=2936508 RepID=UPI00200CD656|nr:bifunctional precorrin-2 dehydrogenase/sirohydrochlorin ferrochelatase [Paenibacillus hamazuiensis]